MTGVVSCYGNRRPGMGSLGHGMRNKGAGRYSSLRSGWHDTGMTTPKLEPTDILIIGAGASGGAAAWRLASAGFKVVVLEQGGWVDPATFPGLSNDWEVRWRSDWHMPRLRPACDPVGRWAHPASQFSQPEQAGRTGTACQTG